jgi:hypothetical protein
MGVDDGTQIETITDYYLKFAITVVLLFCATVMELHTCWVTVSTLCNTLASLVTCCRVDALSVKGCFVA